MTHVYDYFKTLKHEELDGEDVSIQRTKWKEKILGHFGNQVKIESGKNIHGNIIYSSLLSYSEVVDGENSESTQQEQNLRKVALCLRRPLFSCKKTFVGNTVSFDDISRGECQIPKNVENFFELLICGPKKQKKMKWWKRNR